MENKELQEGCSRFKIENYQRNNVHVATITPSDPNEAIRFDNKTDNDIIYHSGFVTLRPIKYLLINAVDSRPAIRRNRKGKIPRPQNSWIIYRRDKSADPRFKGLQPSIIAKEISKMWKEESEEVKGFYAAISREAGRLHKQKHENYKYQPGPYNKSKRPNKNKTSKRSEDKLNTQATVTPSPAVQQLLTPVTTSSSPVLEEQLPQNFPHLSEIRPELLPPELQQQFPLTPASIPYSPTFSENSELNFSEFFRFPSSNTPNIVTPELENFRQQFIEAAMSPFVQEVSTYSQHNNALGIDISFLSQYNNDDDFVLYDDDNTADVQGYDNSQTNFFDNGFAVQQYDSSQSQMDFGNNFFDVQQQCDNSQINFFDVQQQYDNSQTMDNFFDVQQQCENSQNFYDDTNMIDEQVLVNNTAGQDLETLWNSSNEQQKQLILNILTESNLFKKSE